MTLNLIKPVVGRYAESLFLMSWIVEGSVGAEMHEELAREHMLLNIQGICQKLKSARRKLILCHRRLLSGWEEMGVAKIKVNHDVMRQWRFQSAFRSTVLNF